MSVARIFTEAQRTRTPRRRAGRACTPLRRSRKPRSRCAPAVPLVPGPVEQPCHAICSSWTSARRKKVSLTVTSSSSRATGARPSSRIGRAAHEACRGRLPASTRLSAAASAPYCASRHHGCRFRGERAPRPRSSGVISAQARPGAAPASRGAISSSAQDELGAALRRGRRGIPKMADVASSWAIVRPPARADVGEALGTVAAHAREHDRHGVPAGGDGEAP